MSIKVLRVLFIFSNLLVLLAGISSAQCTDAFLETRTIALDQESRAFGVVESAAVLPEGSVVVATADPGVFLFEPDGSFVRQLGRTGRGPFEYRGSLDVRPTGENVAVWDAGNRTLLTFAPTGTELREWTQLGRAVSDFAVRGDTLYAYHSGGINEDFVSIYYYDDQKAPALEFGKAPGEHFPLSLLEGSGGLSYADRHGLLFYASPAEPIVHLYDPGSGDHDSWQIDDPDFTTEAVSAYTSLKDVNANILAAAEQALRSSRFYFLQAVGDRLLSVLQHGELVYEKSLGDARGTGRTESTLDAGGVDTNTRTFSVHLHTQDGDALACEALSFTEDEIESDSPIVGPTPRGFLILTTRTTKEDIEYVLTEYAVPEP